MTEEEAKTKWCPHARSFYWAGNGETGAPVPVNRYTEEGGEAADKWYPLPTTPHADCLCIGSACMAWRWVPLAKKSNFAAPIDGFCGMAGKP